MPYIKAHCHPFLFALITVCAMAELGLTAFLINDSNEKHNWPNQRYQSLVILMEFNAVWTTVFGAAYMLWVVDGAVHVLAGIASSVVWLGMTCVLWGTAAGVMHQTRIGGACTATLSGCRETLTVEILSWVEFGLCLLTLIGTCLWVRTNRRNHVSDSRRLV
ncbi:hypothetical protein SERLADRAFT_389628 [Serpula lacrymans var. lacrymans S7.9]|uniref:MARVEL domain-containing protein n=1 Tax=Serpula lacrymans var. lacrymans (strain S7.9) TaxID=578457 RepID=F8NWS9_SERL9|nr:uncharacterized protein SERLADRAFT_389628 [Serpula lacrymans var. lacrymans S7.9]EGO24428.1 hypothetical protein SERLADRAFT_389628 [Serpula lacrymans var. lacrymans S7.9]